MPALFLPTFPHPTTTAVKYQEKILLLKCTENGESTTTGYDCVKPDLVVMKVAKKLNIVDNVLGDKNFRKTVRFIQEYSIDRKIRPSVVDFYFLIDEGQMGARKFVKPEFYQK